MLEKYDSEILFKEVIERIGEHGHVEDGKVVQTYKKLIKDIKKMMKEVGIEDLTT